MKIDAIESRRYGRVHVLLALLVAVVVTTPFLGLPMVSTAALFGAAVLAWTVRNRDVRWYAATLALPIPQATLALRLSIADVLVVPVVAREALRWWIGIDRSISRTMWPLILLLCLSGVATLIGYYRLGTWSSWALLNKDAGLLFQVLVFWAVGRRILTITHVTSAARWYVIGVSVANIAALLAVVAALAGWANPVYSSRLFGWVGQPTITGGVLMVAAMIELGCLATPPQPGELRTLRWLNLWLLGVSLALTASRSAWASTAAAAAVLLAMRLHDAWRWEARQVIHAGVVSIWLILPAGALSYVVVRNVSAGVALAPEDRAAQLRGELARQCRADPTPEFCRDVLRVGSLAANPRVLPDSAVSSLPATPAVAGAPVIASRGADSPVSEAPKPVELKQPRGDTPAVLEPKVTSGAEGRVLGGAVMNARGLNDRVAILRVAWTRYTESWSSVLFGIGLGTFYATTAPDFGVPLIIHNTFAWFLVEFGPAGLLIVLWLWTQTAVNLRTALARSPQTKLLAIGLMASFAGMTVFCLFNEGFYQRQLWLVMLLAERLSAVTLVAREAADPRLASLSVPASA